MEDTSSCREQYQMKFIFYADSGSSSAINSPVSADAASPSAKTYVVCVRLANTEAKSLTKHNLQVLSLSIPDLHRRLTGRPKPITFHRAYVHWEALSKDAPVRPISTPRPSSSKLHGLIQYELPPKAGRARHEGLGSNTPSPTANTKKDPAPSTSTSAASSCLKATQTQPSDWLQCDGSFIPDVSIKEWSVVSYQGEEFTPCISPLAYTDDAGDIAGRCNVTDYTEYGQLVFSVDVDFLQGRMGTGSHDAGNLAVEATEEERMMRPPGTPTGGGKTPKAKKRLSTPKRRSSGSRVSTPTRSPIRI